MKKTLPELGDMIFILSAVLMWLLAALISTAFAAFIVYKLKLGELWLGYLSSALSFIAALAAGAAAMSKRKKGALYTGFLSALVLIILILTLGLCISGRDIEPSAILSVVSFTMTGALAGSVFYPVKKIKAKPKSFSLGKN